MKRKHESLYRLSRLDKIELWFAGVMDIIIGIGFPIIMVVGFVMLIFVVTIGGAILAGYTTTPADSPVSHYVVTEEVINGFDVTRIVDAHAKTACWSWQGEPLGCIYIRDEDITLWEDGGVTLWGASYCLKGHLCDRENE